MGQAHHIQAEGGWPENDQEERWTSKWGEVADQQVRTQQQKVEDEVTEDRPSRTAERGYWDSHGNDGGCYTNSRFVGVVSIGHGDRLQTSDCLEMFKGWRQQKKHER